MKVLLLDLFAIICLGIFTICMASTREWVPVAIILTGYMVSNAIITRPK